MPGGLPGGGGMLKLRFDRYISFKKQCCDKVLAIVVRVLFTKAKKNSKKQLGNRYSQETV